MENQSRLMFLLAAVLLAMVAVIVLAKPPSPDGSFDDEQSAQTQSAQAQSAAASEPQWTPAFDDLTGAQISRVELQREEESWAAERTESGWQVVAPLSTEADADRVEALVDSLARVQVGEKLDAPEANYGLDEPTATVSLTAMDGRSLVLEVGRESPVGSHSYVRASGPSTGSLGAQPSHAGGHAERHADARFVRATKRSLGPTLEVSLSDLRNHKLWTLPRTGIDKLSVTGPRASLELTRRGADWWVRESLDGESLRGAARRADVQRVDYLLNSLAGQEASGFVDDAPTDLLGALPWHVTARSAGVDQRLDLGPVGDGSWVARGPRQPGVVTVDPVWMDAVLQPVSEWWSTTLLTVTPGSASALTLSLGDRHYEDHRHQDDWPQPQTPDILAALEATLVDRGDTPQPSGEAWGRVSVTRADQTELTLTFYQLLDDGSRVVTDDAGGPAFRIGVEALGLVLQSMQAPSPSDPLDVSAG